MTNLDSILKSRDITLSTKVRLVSSVQFSRSVLSSCLWPHGLQHIRLLSLSPTLDAYSNSCPLSWWCHPTISSSVVPFFSRLQSFTVSGSFPMSQFFISGGQSIGASASVLALPMNIQDWFSLGLTGGSPCRPKNSQESSPTPQFKSIKLFGTQYSLWSNSHIHAWILKKTIALTRCICVDKVMPDF